ncbi:hypothetical protein FQA39_LY16663 [Lamprigera yunnana]|nr:hypothetical protein FQA39_LY16663 [Lamprigera yunnana]
MSEKETEFETKVTDVYWLQSLAPIEGLLESPINVTLSEATPLVLNPLEWNLFEILPKKVKLTNNGRTLIVSIRFFDEVPYIVGGPFTDPFKFSQLHFHWGSNDMEGSEHTVDGFRYPLEMHAVFFSSKYETHEAALEENDGVAIVVYLFKLHAEKSELIDFLLDKLFPIQNAVSSQKINRLPLKYYLRPFADDYFLYWGSIVTTTSTHIILWILPRQPIGVTLEQMDDLRILFNTEEELMLGNFREIQPKGKRRLFHICPGTQTHSSMLPVPLRDEKFELELQHAAVNIST